MKIILNLFLGLFCSAATLAQAHKAKLEIRHLKGDFYIYTTYHLYGENLFPANGMYVITDKGVILIDTPWDTTQFQPLLDSIREKHHKDVVFAIATHSHEDRTAGLEFLRNKDIKTFTSEMTDEISRQKNEKRAEFTFSRDTVFRVGQYSFRAYFPGAGHTPDNIVIWFDKDRILYGGCLVKSTEAKDLGNLADASVKEWEFTMKNLMTRFTNPAYVIPGHQSWESTKSLDHTLNLVKKQLDTDKKK